MVRNNNKSKTQRPVDEKKKDFEIQPNFLRPTFFEVLFYVPNAVGLF